MEYKLAEQLKEAGFPQEGEGQMHHNLTKELRTPPVYVPTLPELIKAVEDWWWKNVEGMPYIHFRLVHSQVEKSGSWSAILEENIRSGKTLEEAVANLWLVLNEKK